MKHFKKALIGLLVLALLLGITGGAPASASTAEEKTTIVAEDGKKPPVGVKTGSTIVLKLKNKKWATWECSKGGGCEIANDGKRKKKAVVSFTKEGKVEIKATYYDGGREEYVTVKKTFRVYNKLDYSGEVILGQSKEKQINKIIEKAPKKYTNIKSSDKKIAKMSKEGKITTGKKYGHATITAISDAAATRGLRYTIEVYVLPQLMADLPAAEDAWYPTGGEAKPLDATPTLIYYLDGDKKVAIDEEVTPTYQWYEVSVPSSGFPYATPLEGETNATFTPNTKEAGIKNYYCEMELVTPDKYKYLSGVALTNRVKVEVGGTVKVVFNANSGYFISGEDRKPDHIDIDVEKGIAAIGAFPDNPKREGMLFAGWATSGSATTPDVDETTVIMKDTTFYAVWKPDKTETHKRTPSATPLVNMNSEAGNIIFRKDADRVLILEVGAESPDEGTLTYQWYKDGVAIAGATERSYSPVADYSSLDKHAYYVRVTNTKSGHTPASKNSEVTYITFVDAEKPLVIHYHVNDLSPLAITPAAITVISTDGKTVETVNRHGEGEPFWGSYESVGDLFDTGIATYTWAYRNANGDDVLIYGETVDFEFASLTTFAAVANKAIWAGGYPLTEAADLAGKCYFFDLYAISVE